MNIIVDWLTCWLVNFRLLYQLVTFGDACDPWFKGLIGISFYQCISVQRDGIVYTCMNEEIFCEIKLLFCNKRCLVETMMTRRKTIFFFVFGDWCSNKFEGNMYQQKSKKQKLSQMHPFMEVSTVRYGNMMIHSRTRRYKVRPPGKGGWMMTPRISLSYAPSNSSTNYLPNSGLNLQLSWFSSASVNCSRFMLGETTIVDGSSCEGLYI